MLPKIMEGMGTVGERLATHGATRWKAGADELRNMSVTIYRPVGSGRRIRNDRKTKDTVRGSDIVSMPVRDRDGGLVGCYYPAHVDFAEEWRYVKNFARQPSERRDDIVDVFDHGTSVYKPEGAPWASLADADGVARTMPVYVFHWVQRFLYEGVATDGVPVLVRRHNGELERWVLHPKDFAAIYTAGDHIEEAVRQRLARGDGIVPWVMTGPNGCGVGGWVTDALHDRGISHECWGAVSDAEIRAVPKAEASLEPTAVPHLRLVDAGPEYRISTLHPILRVDSMKPV